MKINILLVLLFMGRLLWGQEVPRIISYQVADYGADGQNWMITQGCDGSIFVANSDGVLRFNGFNWQLIPFKDKRRVRSVFLGKDCKVYCGGYRNFGVLEQENHSWIYRSISDTIFNNRQEEIWHIFSDENQLFFQSFADVYQYDYEQINLLSPPDNIMFGATLDQGVLFPKIRGGIFQFEDGDFEALAFPVNFPEDAKITGLVRRSNQDLLIATQFDGLFILTEETIVRVNSPIQQLAKRDQINRLLQLSDGRIVIGTIQDGIYILNEKLEILFHINRQSGLSNNTILALFEDRDNDLWVGTDNGLNLIKCSSPNRYYYDRNDLIGSIFVSENHDQQLFLGTNKGLFISEEGNGLAKTTAIKDQVWAFLPDSNGNLLVGHNEGTSLYNKGRIKKISKVTGGLKMQVLPNGKLLQSTYTGWILFTPTATGWTFEQRITGTSVAFLDFLLEGNTIYGFNSNEGLFKQVFNEDFTEVIDSKKLKGAISLPASAKLKFYRFKERIFFCLKNDCYQVEWNSFQKLSSRQDSFALQNLDQKHRYGNHLIPFSGGYAKILAPEDKAMDSIYLESLFVNNEPRKINSQRLYFKSIENNLAIQLASTCFPVQLGDYQYAIAYKEGLPYWSPLPKDGNIRFQALQTGNYQVLLRHNDQLENAQLLSFEIFPPWYASWPGGLIYLGFTFFSYYLIVHYQRKKAKRTREQLLREKEREIEKERILAKNDELEREVNYKSQMLANSTMTLIQKNKMLNELKSYIEEELKQTKQINKTKNRLMHLINRNISSDEDWQIFEHNFNQIHQAFMERLIDEFEQLSPNDLKLAAYIRIGLQSKEIAPLMNISFRSVENNRSRLRKKLNLKSTDNLKDFLLHY